MDWFLGQLGAELVLGQILILRRGSGFEIKHVADRSRSDEELRQVKVSELRALAQFTADGMFRPLKSAPTLQSGWRTVAGNAEELELALQQLYPNVVADWFAASKPAPPVTDYRQFTDRQTGMYRITQQLTNVEAAAVIRACCHANLCLKRRFWSVNGLDPDPVESKSLIPCLEPCAILLESARKAKKHEIMPNSDSLPKATQRTSAVFAVCAGSILAAFLFAGCKPPPTTPVPTSTPASSTNVPKPVAKLDEDVPVLSEADLALVQAAIPATEADRAWRDLQKALMPPAYPADWQDTPPTKDQVAEFEKKSAVAAAAAAEKARQFYTKYPTNVNASEARKREFDLLKVAVDLGNTNSLARLESIESERLKDTSLSEDQRIEIRVQQIQRIMSAASEQTVTNALPKVEKAIRSLQTDFPDRNDLASLTMSVAEAWFDEGNLTRTRALAEEVAKSKAPDEVKEDAQMLVKKIDRVGKPLEIKFTALDGREVDVQKLKEKVVLVDFWATWCGPCMRELPHVKAAYEKLHPKGFEIVGISYDDKKELLQRVVSDEKMTWPQYFDDDGAKKFAEEFGVMKIPTMWLVDKKGVLRDLNGVRDISSKVEKLLAEK